MKTSIMLAAGALFVFAAAATAQEDIGGACGWQFKAEADTVNVAFPDDSANYWVARYQAIPGARIVIRGQYAKARYFSFHVYDEATRPLDRIGDFELDPDEGAVNPFRDPDADPSAPRTYTARVEFTPRPADPAPNTIYAGSLWLDDFIDEPEQTQNPMGFMIYRVYVSDDPESLPGSVPLPHLSLELPDGTEVPLLECTDAIPPSTGETLTTAIAGASFPDEIPRTFPAVLASEDPEFTVFRGLVGSRGGFYSNLHIAYVTTGISRTFGDVFVVRAKAPTAPDTRAGEPIFTVDGEGNEIYPDLRYWSMCQTNFETQRYVQCTSDHEAVVDADGFMTFLISDPDDRPANATIGNAVNWLPWGGIFYDGRVIYRHMLPSPEFAQAIHAVPAGTPAKDVMGEYYPRASYCTKETFESGGVTACFE